MSNGLFEVLASQDAAEQERLGRGRATIAVQTRAKQRFETYVSKATTPEERAARIEVVSGDLDKIAEEVIAEHGFLTLDEARAAGREALGGGHPAGCTCGFCKNKGNLPGAKKDDDGDEDDEPMEKDAAAECDDCEACKDGCTGHEEERRKREDAEYEAAESRNLGPTSKVDIKQASASASEFPWEHVAAGVEVETGDTYAQDRVDLPSNKTDGLGGPSPKIDKGKSGDETGWNLEPIDVPSERHPTEQQSATDRADYTSEDFDPSSPVRDRVDADTPMQPEHNVADKTETWTGTEGQASPVTSAVLSKWTVLP